MDDHVIPVLQCGSVTETLDFYRALGFEVTYEQTRPYQYGAAAKNGAILHFHGGFKPTGPPKASRTYLVMVDEIDATHGAFVESLKANFGRLPTAGLPRITRLRTGQTRFAVFDPFGNSIVYISRDEPEIDFDAVPDGNRSKLAAALDTAIWLRDLKGHDDVAAAKVLDVALSRDDPAPPIDRARVLAARAELAVALGETDRVDALRTELARIPLSAQERERFAHELRAADDLLQLMTY